MKIICDTNVWYNLDSGLIDKPEHELVLTMSTLYDWFASKKMNVNDEEHELLKSAYKYSKENASHILKIDPFDYAAVQLYNYEPTVVTVKSIDLMLSTLDEIVAGHYNNDKIMHIRKKCIKSKCLFSKAIKKNNKILFEECSNKKGAAEKRKYKLNKPCVNRFIKNWIKTFPGFEGQEIGTNEFNKMKIFIDVKYNFMNNKPKEVDPNSMVDLVNFLYLVENDGKYWSEEKEFLDLVKQAYSSEIPEFIYEGGLTVQKIFN